MPATPETLSVCRQHQKHCQLACNTRNTVNLPATPETLSVCLQHQKHCQLACLQHTRNTVSLPATPETLSACLQHQKHCQLACNTRNTVSLPATLETLSACPQHEIAWMRLCMSCTCTITVRGWWRDRSCSSRTLLTCLQDEDTWTKTLLVLVNF